MFYCTVYIEYKRLLISQNTRMEFGMDKRWENRLTVKPTSNMNNGEKGKKVVKLINVMVCDRWQMDWPNWQMVGMATRKYLQRANLER